MISSLIPVFVARFGKFICILFHLLDCLRRFILFYFYFLTKFLIFHLISDAPCLFLDNRLDVYIHDYLVKRDLKASAQAFQAEGKVSSDPVGKII